jgi:LEA14-like dessication related protein
MVSTGVRARHAVSGVGLVVCALGSVSCSTKPPGFTVVDIVIADSTPEATILDVVLEGTNGNTEPLPLYEIRYTMVIDGQSVATATRSPQATIPKRGTQSFRIPVAVPVSSVAADRIPEASYQIRGSVTYELPGTIAQLFFDSNIRRPSQGFTETGSFAPEAVAEIRVEPVTESPPAE